MARLLIKLLFSLVLCLSWPVIAIETSTPSSQIPEVLAQAVETQFPKSTILAYSPQCQSDTKGASQIGLVVHTTPANSLHPVVGVLSPAGWVLSEMSKSVESNRGATSDFLREFRDTFFWKQLQVRCTNPKKDPDINIESHGEFIAHRGGKNTAQHICFSASNVYNSWVCYWTKPHTTKPKLSFVQFNAD